MEKESRVEVIVTTKTSDAPHKAGEEKLYIMFDGADPDGDKLYFTEAEWEAFVLGVKDGEFDLDEDGNLPPIPLQPRGGHEGADGYQDETGEQFTVRPGYRADLRAEFQPRQ